MKRQVKFVLGVIALSGVCLISTLILLSMVLYLLRIKYEQLSWLLHSVSLLRIVKSVLPLLKQALTMHSNLSLIRR